MNTKHIVALYLLAAGAVQADPTTPAKKPNTNTPQATVSKSTTTAGGNLTAATQQGNQAKVARTNEAAANKAGKVFDTQHQAITPPKVSTTTVTQQQAIDNYKKSGVARDGGALDKARKKLNTQPAPPSPGSR